MNKEVYLVEKDNKLFCLKIYNYDNQLGFQQCSEIEILTNFCHPSLIRASEILDLDNYGLGLLLPLGKLTLKTGVYRLEDQEIYNGMRDLASALHFLHTHKFTSPSLNLDNIIIRGDYGKRRMIITSFDDVKIGQQEDYKLDIYNLGLLYFKLLTKNIDYHSDNDQRLDYLNHHLRRYPKMIIELLFRMLDSDSQTRPDINDVINSGFFITDNNYQKPNSYLIDNNSEFLKYWYSKINGNLLSNSNFLLKEKEMLINRR